MLAGLQGLLHEYFNPRSREGSDGRLGYDRPLQPISIHAPVKGATPSKG